MRMAGPLCRTSASRRTAPVDRSIRWKPSSSASTSRPLHVSAIEPTSLGVRHSLYRPCDMRRTSLALESTQYSDWSRASHSGHSPSRSRVSPMISCRTLMWPPARSCSLLDEIAAAFRQRTKHLLGRDRGAHRVEVVLALGLRGALHLDR